MDFSDFLVLQTDNGKTGAYDADINGDGTVNNSDFLILQADTGRSVAYLNDPLVTHPAHGSFRDAGGGMAGIALSPFGHQGLHHDRVTGNAYNRARMLSTRLQRFMQRDPLGYIDGDGMSTYAYYVGLHGGLDPFGFDESPIQDAIDTALSDGKMTMRKAFAIPLTGDEAFQIRLSAYLSGVNASPPATAITIYVKAKDSQQRLRGHTENFDAWKEMHGFPASKPDKECFEARAIQVNIKFAQLAIAKAHNKKLRVYTQVLAPTGELIVFAGEAPLLITSPLTPTTAGPTAATSAISRTRPKGIDPEKWDNAVSGPYSSIDEAGIQSQVYVHGSRVLGTQKASSDVDVLIKVSDEEFERIIDARYIDVNPGSNRHKEMLKYKEEGFLRADKAGGQIRAARDAMQEQVGTEVHLTIIRYEGKFDNGLQQRVARPTSE